LNETKPTILKIGGSVITDKNGEPAPRTDVIDRLAMEIQEANVKNLVIVHGGGSLGHPTAQQYGIQDGLKEESQKVGFADTHNVMTVLNGLVIDALILHNIPAVSITPSSCVITENGRIKIFEDSALRLLMTFGFTPVLYGDAVLDQKMGFTILSGDQIISFLACKLGAHRIVVGGDTDGVYDADPNVVKTAKSYPHLTLEDLKKIQGRLGKSTATDVTGGMLGKMTELVPAIEQGIPVTIVNAKKADHVYSALVGDKVEGTVIEKV
jgi:isopentenyl phosphate kinase